MDSCENPPSEPAAGPSPAAVLASPEMAALWPEIPRRARRMILTSAGRQWYSLWMEGVPLADIPPRAWGWKLDNHEQPLSLPAELAMRRKRRLPQGQLVQAMAAWLNDGSLQLSEREKLCVLSVFGKCGSLGRPARRNFAIRVSRAARSYARSRARNIYDDVVEETDRHCRQSVDCRAMWLPDTSLSAGEFRRQIENVLRSPDTVMIKHSNVALVARTMLLGEDVVIKRHRLGNPFKQAKYRWRMSRARRAWTAGLTLRRLGLPVAEPLGFVEVVRSGRVTDSYIITRWLSDCRSAEDVAAGLGSVAGRRVAVALWRDAWLRLLDRGIYHADTKLSNAMVRQEEGGRYALFWTDLECVHSGGLLTPYRILRNVVQMNGSLGASFPMRARLEFLRRLPSSLQWLRARWCLKIVARWTARRSR